MESVACLRQIIFQILLAFFCSSFHPVRSKNTNPFREEFTIVDFMLDFTALWLVRSVILAFKNWQQAAQEGLGFSTLTYQGCCTFLWFYNAVTHEKCHSGSSGNIRESVGCSKRTKTQVLGQVPIPAADVQVTSIFASTKIYHCCSQRTHFLKVDSDLKNIIFSNKFIRIVFYYYIEKSFCFNVNESKSNRCTTHECANNFKFLYR